jgi:hypothetical protein
MDSPAQTKNYLSDQFTVRVIEFDENGKPLFVRNAAGTRRYPIYIHSDGNMMDTMGNDFLLLNENTQFRWSGGGYFNVPTVFHTLDTPIEKINVSAGKFVNAELGTIRVRYNPKKDRLTIKSSFGSNPTILETKGQYYDLEEVDYDLLVKDNDTLIIGNSWVFNLVFTRK